MQKLKELEKNSEQAETELPTILPMLPLRGLLVFPHMVTPLDVGRAKSVNALEEAMVQERKIVLVAQKEAGTTEPEPEDVYRVGVVGEIKQLLKMPEGQIRILVEGLERTVITEFLQTDPFYQVRIEPVQETVTRGAELEALVRSVLDEFEQYVKLGKKIPVEALVTLRAIENPSHVADAIAAQLTGNLEERQELMEEGDVNRRLELIYQLMTKEKEIIMLEKKIHGRVRRQIERNQKEYYLREQAKAIQRELGEDDEKTAEVNEYKEKIEKARMPAEAKKKALHELGRLEKMPPMAAEAVVVRTYLDWMVSLPWKKQTRDRLDVDLAAKILDEDHFGLEKVKERILEFLAVRKLSKSMKGPILCLVGPPGVGKTSLARSVARALNRKFSRFSLGGVRDEAEIRGHRRTYIGAMPGKIIQALRQVESRNPVILLDEVDKMSMDFRGDPSAALLEALDPEQNNNFGDHYLEVTFDLSDVLFITTANVLQQIPGPLRDRMEVITIAGYTEEEKLEIAKRHLLAKQIKANGLKDGQISVSENTLRQVISQYTRESGVRNLEREIGTICRKCAREIVQGTETPINVTTANLKKFLGPPRFTHTKREEEDLVGMATGMAYTELGGEILPVEVAVVKGKGKLILTGQLGDVMRESAQASFSYIRSRSTQLQVDPDFYENADIHIHVPEGAIPKDGPSAGITITTALASALTNRPVRSDLAMTGEITLRGRVLPIGGVKEKVLAAHRSGITKILLPKDNKKDLEDIPANVQRQLDITFVNHMDEVLEHALLPPVSPPPWFKTTPEVSFITGSVEPQGGWMEPKHEPQ